MRQWLHAFVCRLLGHAWYYEQELRLCSYCPAFEPLPTNPYRSQA